MGITITGTAGLRVVTPIGAVVAWLKSFLSEDVAAADGPFKSAVGEGEQDWDILFSFTGAQLVAIGMPLGVHIYWSFQLKRHNELGDPVAPAQLKMELDGVIDGDFDETSTVYQDYSYTITTDWDADTNFVVYGFSDNSGPNRYDTWNQNNKFGFATVTLPDGWVECNGQTLDDSESVYDGLDIPDLNGSVGTQRFLRGHTISGETGGTETHRHDLTTAEDAAAPGSKEHVTLAHTEFFSTLPSYYEVVWVMRIK